MKIKKRKKKQCSERNCPNVKILGLNVAAVAEGKESLKCFCFLANDRNLQQKWLNYCQNENLNNVTTANLRVRLICEKHFSTQQYRDLLKSFGNALETVAYPDIAYLVNLSLRKTIA